MKKLLLIALFVLLAVNLGIAQAYIPTTDVLGAHNNGGRGCAGCHAPHSGNRGSGGETIAGGATPPVSTGGAEGDYHLWGTDVSLITQETLNVGGGYGNGGVGYVLNFGGASQYTSTSLPVVASIASCLSCHDGNFSKGAMMTGYSYEQATGMLAKIVGAGTGATTGPLYGTAPIPTWLGNESAAGGPAGDYLNDHPVGPNANINGLAYPSAGPGLSSYGLTYTTTTNSIAWTAAGEYANFLTNYGAPGIAGMVVDPTNQVPYVVCTTCHNQHQMTVYAASAARSGPNLSAIQGKTTGTYATYFFVNAPYNPGAAWSTTLAPSTTQFCRQCHFGVSNEAFSSIAIGTAF